MNTMQDVKWFDITDEAKNQMEKLLSKNPEKYAVSLEVKGGGCAGFKYEYWVGAHARGFNKISLGVCLIGKKNFTKKQYESLEKVLRTWKRKYPKTEIIGHYVISDSKKTCPNFDVKKWCIMKKLI